MTGPQHRVYALRYAYREESVRGEHFFGHDDACHAPMPIDYHVWAVVGDDPLVRERFPAEPGLSGLVHRIDHDPSGYAEDASRRR